MVTFAQKRFWAKLELHENMERSRIGDRSQHRSRAEITERHRYSVAVTTKQRQCGLPAGISLVFSIFVEDEYAIIVCPNIFGHRNDRGISGGIAVLIDRRNRAIAQHDVI